MKQFVSGPGYPEDVCLEKGVHHRTLANFLVTQHVGGIASTPALFFVELSNDDDDADRDSQLICCPVNFPPPGMLTFLLCSFFYLIHIVPVPHI